jgi:hypothetical protein
MNIPVSLLKTVIDRLPDASKYDHYMILIPIPQTIDAKDLGAENSEQLIAWEVICDELIFVRDEKTRDWFFLGTKDELYKGNNLPT